MTFPTEKPDKTNSIISLSGIDDIKPEQTGSFIRSMHKRLIEKALED